MTAIIESPQFAVMASPGTNRDFATVAALEAAGARAEIVHIGALVEEPSVLLGFQGLIIPGGFSHGDDIQSGVVLALRMQHMKHELEEFSRHLRRPIVGVCNGFQALVQSGLLPFGDMVPRDQLKATLTNNTSGRFESRWIYLAAQASVSQYIQKGEVITLPVDHGEGKFMASPAVVEQIEGNGQVVYRYSESHGSPTQEYPANPNDAVNAIAGITDPTGVILGMMPHPEDFIIHEHHPNWRRGESLGEPDGLRFFKNVVVYAANI